MRQLFAPECANGSACTELFVHMLIYCILYKIPGKKWGARLNSIIIFHYTLQEHIYLYVSSQFKLTPEHQPRKCNLLVPPVWILQANHSGTITLRKTFSNIRLRFAGCFDDSLSTAQDKSKLIVKECEEKEEEIEKPGKFCKEKGVKAPAYPGQVESSE